MVSNNLIPQKNFNLPFKLHQMMFRIKKSLKGFNLYCVKTPNKNQSREHGVFN